MHEDLETTDIEKFKRRSDKSVRVIAILLAKNGLTNQLENILVNLIVVITQIGNNFGYLHQLHFLASFLYISWI